MMRRGDIYWCHPGEPQVSAPARRRPVLVVQSDEYNASRLATTVVVVLTSKTTLSTIPGNVFLPTVATGLPRDSVANVTALLTVHRRDLDPHPVGGVPERLLLAVEDGLRQVLDLRPTVAP